MAPKEPPPKALLFDIGGVCVVSPFQAILDYELANSIPPGYVNFAISRTAPNGAWHQLERGEVPMDSTWFAAFTADLQREDLWRQHWDKSQVQSASKKPAPPIPSIDGEFLFWEMMRISRSPDPHMYPALLKLRDSGAFLLSALSNTVIFPAGHPYNSPAEDRPDVRGLFTPFVSSAHVGMRKPEPAIYAFALARMREVLRYRHGGGPEGQLAAGDVLFVDDIGENLRIARKLGMRTLKVRLGETNKAVEALEEITGLSLVEGKVPGKL